MIAVAVVGLKLLRSLGVGGKVLSDPLLGEQPTRGILSDLIPTGTAGLGRIGTVGNGLLPAPMTSNIEVRDGIRTYTL